MFLVVFLSLYGLAHAYTYLKLQTLFRWTGFQRFFALGALLFLFISPVLGHVVASPETRWLDRIVLVVGYEWMGLLFLFICAHLFLEALRLLVFLFNRTLARGSIQGLPRTAYWVVSAAAVTVYVYGHFEVRDLRLETVELTSPKVAHEANPLRIVQITDLHFSAVNGAELAARIAARVESLDPDLLAVTGDLVDRGISDPEEIQRIFRSIKAPLGKYAIVGNHEVYRGLQASVRFLEDAGFEVLRGEARSPLPWLTVIGVDDEAVGRVGRPQGRSLDDLLEEAPPENLTILLRHRPIVEKENPGRMDLQLSGHTHGGQIFPFGFVVARAFPYLKGVHTLGEGSVLYVSRGTGTWGPRIRVGSPPEITLIVYSSEKKQ